ncbi:MAG: hypothetical protein ACYC6N_26285 [Pirellulaceae bacterium]
MRGITLTLALLLVIGYVASRAGLPAVCSSGTVSIGQEDGWRRTAQGWEQNTRWNVPAMQPAPASSQRFLHPAIIAGLQLLVALLMLCLDHAAHRAHGGVRPRCEDAAAQNSRCPAGV